MIEERMIDGKKAIVVYIDEDFNPVDKRSPDVAMRKIIFRDGTVRFEDVGRNPNRLT